MGIVSAPVDAAGTEMESLVHLNAVCVMASTHRLAAKRSISAKDLDGQAFIASGRGDNLRAATEETFTSNKVRPVQVAEMTHSITVCLLALQGVGVVWSVPSSSRRWHRQV